MGSSCQMCYQAGHTGDMTAPGTWAPEQNCPSLVCLPLKRGTHHCFASLIHSQAIFCYLQQPSLRISLLSSLSFIPFSSQSTPSYLLDTHPCPGHYPVAGEMRVAQLCKSPHSFFWDTPPVPHLVHTRNRQNQCQVGVLMIRKTKYLSFLEVKYQLSNICTTP